MDYRFALDLAVRDYECDMQGIVNNSVYQNYLEHTRHEFLLSHGLSFAELTQQNIHLVVARAELDYKAPLKSGDQLKVGLNLERHGRLQLLFNQDIVRKSDQKLCVKAKIFVAAIKPGGRPYFPDFLQRFFD